MEPVGPGPLQYHHDRRGWARHVMASRVLAICFRKGLLGHHRETFGASQRGGSVMSHIRVSATTTGSPSPKGKAHVVIALEPWKRFVIMSSYGNRG